jgi:uncharacterized membrane protein YphA (DoxX/SURF4 family)
MLLVTELFKWWYTAGLRQRLKKISVRLDGTIDYFSMDLLVKTLFAPFRQISAGRVRGPIGVQLRAWFDRLISRVIGAIVRSMVIVIGIFALVVAAVIGMIRLIAWPLIPVSPIIAVVFALIGWVPWTI